MNFGQRVVNRLYKILFPNTNEVIFFVLSAVPLLSVFAPPYLTVIIDHIRVLGREGIAAIAPDVILVVGILIANIVIVQKKWALSKEDQSGAYFLLDMCYPFFGLLIAYQSIREWPATLLQQINYCFICTWAVVLFLRTVSTWLGAKIGLLEYHKERQRMSPLQADRRRFVLLAVVAYGYLNLFGVMDYNWGRGIMLTVGYTLLTDYGISVIARFVPFSYYRLSPPRQYFAQPPIGYTRPKFSLRRRKRA